MRISEEDTCYTHILLERGGFGRVTRQRYRRPFEKIAGRFDNDTFFLGPLYSIDVAASATASYHCVQPALTATVTGATKMIHVFLITLQYLTKFLTL